ncbi:MAG: thiamine pyrophosphate-binding protein, partial [Actinomycetota bacterium]
MSEEEDSKPTIQVEHNGPLLVKGLNSFYNSRGEEIATSRSLRLCRCGHSQTKPFCDNTHARIGWTDEKSDERVPDRLDVYEGSQITIRDNRGICSHAGYCTSCLPEVWKMGTEPWIDPDGADAEKIIETIHKCPSGALSYERDGEVHTEFHDQPAIFVSSNGPYRVTGGIALDAEPGEGASREHFTLCRCGQSRNKPFCDGSHWYAGFKDDEALTISQANRARSKTRESWVDVGKASEFESGKVYSVEVEQTTAALVKSGGQWHALQARCPHQGGPLDEGSLCDGALRCPWHGYDFALDTGKGVGNELSAATLEVREQDGQVQILAPKPVRSSWTVSHVIAETLVSWGVDTVFGMVGHSNLGMAEALRIQQERGKLRYFGIRHEGAASFACSGYAKVSGRPAVCLSIAGPGATNLLTGLWDAKVDRAPVLALTGQINTQVLGPGAFQEIDLASAFAAVTRFSQPVLTNSNHAELVALALKTAIVERDVAHLILPDEVQTTDAGKEGPSSALGRVSDTGIEPASAELDEARWRLDRSKRPVIIVGYGAREHMEDIERLAESLDSPVVTTFKAKGQIADDHPLGAGVLGRSGTPVASWFMNEADLLLVFGASFSDHTGITTSKPIIQVDFDRMALGKFHPVDQLIWADIGKAVQALFRRIDGQRDPVQRAELAERWKTWREEKKRRRAQDNGAGINSALIFQALSEAVPDDAVICVDVGSNTYSFGRYFECRGRQKVIMSGYLG